MEKVFKSQRLERMEITIGEAKPILQEIEMEKHLNSDQITKDAILHGNKGSGKKIYCFFKKLNFDSGYLKTHMVKIHRLSYFDSDEKYPLVRFF